MAMITNDWLDAVKPEFSKEYYKDLFCFVKDEYSKCVVYPPADDIFNAFHFHVDDCLRIRLESSNIRTGSIS